MGTSAAGCSTAWYDAPEFGRGFANGVAFEFQQIGQRTGIAALRCSTCSARRMLGAERLVGRRREVCRQGECIRRTRSERLGNWRYLMSI